MSWLNVVWLYPRRLRARLVQESFAFVGIAVGVALLFAVQVSNSSLSSSIAQLTTGLVGRTQLQLVARETQGFPQRLVARVQRDRDVQAAAPVLEAPANIVGPRGAQPVTLLAADEHIASLGGTLLPGGAAAVLSQLAATILPQTVARVVGARLGVSPRLQIAGHTIPVPVAAILGPGALGALGQAPVVLAPLALGQALAGLPGRVSRVWVLARPGREAAVRRMLTRLAGDRLDVRPADFDEQVFAQASQPNDQSTALFSRVAALVGFLFAFNALLLSARERRRSIAQLRISGHSVRTVRRMLTLDALVLGVLASAAGLLLGDQLSRHVFTPAPGYLTFGFPIGTARIVHWPIFAAAFAAGLVATLLGTLAPLLAGRAELLGEERVEAGPTRRPVALHWRLLAAGLTGLVAMAVVYVLAPTLATLGLGLLVGSMLLCLPAILVLTLAGATRVAHRVRSPVAVLAIGELRANGVRSATLVGVAAIAVCASGAIEGAHHDLQAGLDRGVHGVSATTDVWASPASVANQLGVAPFRPDAQRVIARLPHVARVDVYRGQLLTVGVRRVWVFGPPRSSRDPIPRSEVLDGDPVLANARVRAGGWAAVSHAIATEHHLHLGQAFTLPAPHPTRLRVAAVITNIGWPPGTIVINADTFKAAWGSSDASALQIRFDPGTAPSQGRRIVAHALAGGPWSGLTVETAAQREGHQRRASRAGLARITQIARLVLLTAALAMAIAITASIWQRRPGLATLRLSGIRRTRLYQALLVETGLLLLIGCLTGALFALLGVPFLDRWLTSLTGFPVVHSTGICAVLTSLAAVTIAALALTLLPGYRAANVPADVAFQE